MFALLYVSFHVLLIMSTSSTNTLVDFCCHSHNFCSYVTLVPQPTANNAPVCPYTDEGVFVVVFQYPLSHTCFYVELLNNGNTLAGLLKLNYKVIYFH